VGAADIIITVIQTITIDSTHSPKFPKQGITERQVAVAPSRRRERPSSWLPISITAAVLRAVVRTIKLLWLSISQNHQVIMAVHQQNDASGGEQQQLSRKSLSK